VNNQGKPKILVKRPEGLTKALKT